MNIIYYVGTQLDWDRLCFLWNVETTELLEQVYTHLKVKQAVFLVLLALIERSLTPLCHDG